MGTALGYHLKPRHSSPKVQRLWIQRYIVARFRSRYQHRHAVGAGELIGGFKHLHMSRAVNDDIG